MGLTLTYAMALMGLFQWGVRQSAEVENQVSYSSSTNVFFFFLCGVTSIMF